MRVRVQLIAVDRGRSGHALNKVLKDVVNRYKLLRGHNIKYVRVEIAPTAPD
jgi:hypothetical protein